MSLPAKAPKPAAPAPAQNAAAKPTLASVGSPVPRAAQSPAPATRAAPAPSSAPQQRRLKKGELLFAEGENSRAMYFLKTGMIRLYKKKGDSSIELDTVRSGQCLGELAFLDGNPRSASGEALTDCELVEISGTAFQEVLVKMPDWLKILLKTVVGRLRTASTRIRQLETASTAFDYSDKSGNRSANYVYLSPHDVLKICAGILLVGSRNSTKIPEGLDLNVPLLQRYINQVMGIPVAKLTTFQDTLVEVGVLAVLGDGSGQKIVLKDINFLEQFIGYLNDENLLEPSKRHDISQKTLTIMSLMVKHLGRAKKDDSGLTVQNIAEVRKLETVGGREPFRLDDFPELAKMGYASHINLKSADEAYSTFNADVLTHAYRMQRVVLAIADINEQKRKSGSTAK